MINIFIQNNYTVLGTQIKHVCVHYEKVILSIITVYVNVFFPFNMCGFNTVKLSKIYNTRTG